MTRSFASGAVVAVALSAVLLALITGSPAMAQQGSGTTVTGSVTNGTADGEVPVGLPVDLQVLSDGEVVDVYTTTTSSDGSFGFAGLELPDGSEVQALITYQDVLYQSEPVTATQDAELTVAVPVYEVTDDPASVEITQLHMFITGEQDRQVLEYYLISNAGDRTYVGQEDATTGQRVTMGFSLPDGADSVSIDSSGGPGQFLESDHGLLSMEPVRPGVATVETMLVYRLPGSGQVMMQRAFDLPVRSVVLLVLQGELSLQGPALQLSEVVDTGSGPAQSYIAGPLAPGEPLAFEIVPGPGTGSMVSPTGVAPARNSQLEVALGLVALAIALVGVYLLWRRPSVVEAPAAAQPLLKQVAALDARFETGDLDERDYRRKRGALVRRVRALVVDRPHD